MGKLTQAQRSKIQQEIYDLTNDAEELARKAQRLQRVLDRDAWAFASHPSGGDRHGE